MEIFAALQQNNAEAWTNLTAFDLMTVDPITVQGDVLAVKALEKMEFGRCKPITVLPVVDVQNHLMGLLRLHDLIQAGLTRHLCIGGSSTTPPANSAACA